MLTEQEVYKRFLQSVQDAGGQRRWAEAHGVTPAYVNDMVNRRRRLSERVLAMIGIEMEVTIIYREQSTPKTTPAAKMTRGVRSNKPHSDEG